MKLYCFHTIWCRIGIGCHCFDRSSFNCFLDNKIISYPKKNWTIQYWASTMNAFLNNEFRCRSLKSTKKGKEKPRRKGAFGFAGYFFDSKTAAPPVGFIVFPATLRCILIRKFSYLLPKMS